MREKEAATTDQELIAQYEVVLVRPGGNDTAFVTGVYNQSTRKEINDAIMRSYPSIEQVAFVSGQSLEMAGGEFCLNATRAYAWMQLNGKQGEVMITTSGIDMPLRCGVNTQGDAWVQLPVNVKDRPLIDLGDEKSRVELSGITHLVVAVGAPLNTAMSLNDIKDLAVKMLDKENLRETVPAAGVMFVSKYKNSLYLEPVVWVRDIQTLFYETACGSGTTAAGLVLTKGMQIGQKIKFIQPSGLPIWFEMSQVAQSDEFFVTISGPVKKM